MFYDNCGFAPFRKHLPGAIDICQNWLKYCFYFAKSCHGNSATDRGEVFPSFPFSRLSFSSALHYLSFSSLCWRQPRPSSAFHHSISPALFLLFLCAHLLPSLCFPFVPLYVSKPTDQFSRDITALVRRETDPNDCSKFLLTGFQGGPSLLCKSNFWASAEI